MDSSLTNNLINLDELGVAYLGHSLPDILDQLWNGLTTCHQHIAQVKVNPILRLASLQVLVEHTLR